MSTCRPDGQPKLELAVTVTLVDGSSDLRWVCIFVFKYPLNFLCFFYVVSLFKVHMAIEPAMLISINEKKSHFGSFFCYDLNPL